MFRAWDVDQDGGAWPARAGLFHHKGPRVRVYADNLLLGRTPATISAELSALKVILPA